MTEDINKMAARVVEQSTETRESSRLLIEEAGRRQQRSKDNQTGKNPAAVALGKLGGQKGGKARAAALSAKRRQQIARRAAKSRWNRKK